MALVDRRIAIRTCFCCQLYAFSPFLFAFGRPEKKKTITKRARMDQGLLVFLMARRQEKQEHTSWPSTAHPRKKKTDVMASARRTAVLPAQINNMKFSRRSMHGFQKDKPWCQSHVCLTARLQGPAAAHLRSSSSLERSDPIPLAVLARWTPTPYPAEKYRSAGDGLANTWAVSSEGARIRGAWAIQK